VGIFRRREPLHARLARQGGLELEGAQEEPARPAWDQAGIHGIQRTRRWDTVVTLNDPELAGERVAFIALSPEQLVLVEGEADVRPLAEAVERALDPPFRAEAVRRDGGLWAIAARRLDVVHLPDATGEEIELTSHDGERTLLVDGERTFGSIPELERPEHVVRARRIDGDAWEVEVAPL
jgi:hypothetical protein